MYQKITKDPRLEKNEKLFSDCMIPLMSVDIEFWNKPLSMNISPVPVLFVSCLLSCIGLSVSSVLFNANLGSSVVIKSALNQSMRYLERTASDLPVSQPTQLNLESCLTSKINPLLSFTSFSLQNKVLAVIEAIEAAQYLISHNATQLINRVKRRSLCSC